MKSSNYDLEERTLQFSARLVKHVSTFTRLELKAIVSQVIRSSTSIGANYCEANNASSKQDFKNKIFISKKETAETRYWLLLLKELGDSSKENNELLQEATELLLIFQKIVTTLRGKSEN